MNDAAHLDELLSCRLDTGKRAVKPCTIVIFGASGDLTYRKLIPALYHLFIEGQLPVPFRIIGYARREKTDASWREELHVALGKFSRTQPIDEVKWTEFAANIDYCVGDLTESTDFEKLKTMIEAGKSDGLRSNLLFYLSIGPTLFGKVVENLHTCGLLQRLEQGGESHRVVVEKPFGQDLQSAKALNAELIKFCHEAQIFRIDHYLGKETVQNILTFRFSNSIFEQIWNRNSVDNVQITVSEKLGVGARGGYYEEAGAMRDMVQNHLLQVLSLVAMEPPVSLDAESIRDEKVKLLRSIRPISTNDVPNSVVRGQYTAGEVAGEQRPAYRHEIKVAPDSTVETYVAIRLFIDNWRWSNIPFYLRTGKNLPLSASEVRVQFRKTPHVLYTAQCGPKLDSNAITIRLQPDEGISLRFNGKVPGASMQLRPVRMHFGYDSEFGAYTPEAYERLLLEAVAGDATLFIRRDEVETAWGIVDPIRAAWQNETLTGKEFYPAGSWGPVASDELLAQLGHAWRNPQQQK